MTFCCKMDFSQMACDAFNFFLLYTAHQKIAGWAAIFFFLLLGHKWGSELCKPGNNPIVLTPDTRYFRAVDATCTHRHRTSEVGDLRKSGVVVVGKRGGRFILSSSFIRYLKVCFNHSKKERENKNQLKSLPFSLAGCPSWSCERAFRLLLTPVFARRPPPIALCSRHPEIYTMQTLFYDCYS